MFSAALLTINAGHALPLLLDVAVKSLLVSASALAALVCLPRASAATRHLVLLASLGVLLGLPALMALLPRWVPPLTLGISGRTSSTGLNPRALEVQAPAFAGEDSRNTPMPAQAGIRSITARGFSPVTEPVTNQAPPTSIPALRPAWLVLGWLVGVLACAGRMLATQARMWRLTRRCPPLPPSSFPSAGPETAPFAALLTGPAGTPPMVWGWPRAVLLLPLEAADWPDARRRAVVLHESAHVRRQDWLTQTVAQAACALYWFNPLLWLLAARLGAEAERACDDAVLLAGVPPTDYAQDLLAVARSLGAGRAARRVSVGAVTMARRSPVRGRLEAILDTRRVRRRVTRRSALLAFAAALAVAAPLASLRPAARADEGRAARATPTPGVPTEAEIAKVRLHLQGLEQARADYAAAHPNTLSLTQTGYLDGLRGLTEYQHTMKRLAATGTGAEKEKDPHRRAILLKVLKEQDAAATQVARNYRAMVKPRVDMIPAAQVAREARMHDFDEAVALGKTRVEMMQMEHSLGYPLHIRPDNLAVIAHTALYWERTGRMSRADSVHVSLLQWKMRKEKRLDDADVDSLIVILRKPSADPSINRSDVMQLFSMLPQSSPAQQQKMREAITPLLRSRSHWERDQAQQALKKLGGDAGTPPTQKAQAIPAAAVPSARLQPAQQAAQTGVPPMTSLTSMKATMLKTAAFATLTTGLMLPAAHAAPLPSAPKSVAQVAPADALHWDLIALQHTTLQATIGLMHWGNGSPNPDGVKHIVYMMGKNTVLVQATPAGLARMQELIRALDVAPPQVQIKVATATVSAAALGASGIHFEAVLSDGLGTAGRPRGMSTKVAEGDAVGAYLAALTGQDAVSQALVAATLGSGEAYIDLSHIPITPGLKSAELGVTGRINADSSVTVRLEPILSRLITGRTDPDGTPAATMRTFQTQRTVRSGTTLVLANPLPPAGAGERYLLLFVTPTVVPGPDPVAAPIR